MPWVRLDDKFHANPKVMTAGNAAVGLYARALSYCGDLLTDGFVPKAWATANGTRALESKLEACGLWIRVEGGYQIPDYLAIGNPSRAEVEAKREADRIRKESRRKPLGVPPDSSPPSPSPVPSPGTAVLQRNVKGSLFEGLDEGRRHDVEKILRRVKGADDGTRDVLAFYAAQLTLGRVAKVRESVELQAQKVGSGWAVNALKDEIADARRAAA